MLAHFVPFSLAVAQALRFGVDAPDAVSLGAPHVNLIPGTTAARFQQVDALVANGDWDDAVEILRELAAEETDRLVAVEDDRFVDLRTYAHMQISRLPPEALAVYRQRVDATAERWYREGLAARDEATLRRVVDECFASSWGDDALLALGELALGRADYAAARRAWEQISPLLRDPAGRPLWLTLHGIDLAAHWPAIVRRWHERAEPPHWLAYPDTALDLGAIRARLALVSIRAGELDRAALELEAFRRFHPQATGRFGGQEGPYADVLARLLAAARDWPPVPSDGDWATFAGSPDRARVAEPLATTLTVSWPHPVRLPTIGAARGEASAGPWQHSYFPVVAHGHVLYGDAAQLRAVDLATGRPVVTQDGVVYRASQIADDATRSGFDLLRRGRTFGVPRFTMTVADGVLYARVGRVTTGRLQTDRGPVAERLIGLDLTRDGLLVFQVRPDDNDWSFDGAPVSDGRRVFVAMRNSDVTPRAYVACFDAATGRRLWRTSIGAADTLATGQGDEITHNLLTLVGDRIYLNTNLGLVAAIDADDGHFLWIHRYERGESTPRTQAQFETTRLGRDPSPCLFADGLLIVAPSDNPSVFALDADTGQLVWSTPYSSKARLYASTLNPRQVVWASDRLLGAVHLLGVVDGRLIVAGDQLSSLDVRTGRVHWTWPESPHAGIRGAGRGVVAGSEVFWPTAREIYILDAITGAQTRPPIDLRPVGSRGANLAVADNHLIAAGATALLAFGPHAPPSNDTNQSSLTQSRKGAKAATGTSTWAMEPTSNSPATEVAFAP